MSIDLKGKVRIENGENVVEGSNKFVRNAAVMLMGVFMLHEHSHNRDLGRHLIDVETGHDTDQETSWNLNVVVDSMDVPPDVLETEPVEGDGQYKLKVMATWNEGSLSGTLGEVGFFLAENVIPFEEADSSIHVEEWADEAESGMWSRMCVADGDFEAFEIDENSPITIEWHMIFEFKGGT